MTYREIYLWACDTLKKQGVPDAEIDAGILLDFAASLNRARYYLCQDEIIDPGSETCYRKAVEKRAARIPLQHITGVQEFMGFPFQVNENVLTPRQDTETLAEQAIGVLREGDSVLDLCTGSGCIIISLARLCPGIRAAATELSGKALETARSNAQRNGVKIQFFQADLFTPIEGKLTGPFDLIVSNPPYIPTDEIDSLMDEVRLHEPRIALDGDRDGLNFYRRIARESTFHLKKGGRLMVEIGCGQAEAVCALFEENLFRQVRVIKDLSGLDRVVRGILT